MVRIVMVTARAYCGIVSGLSGIVLGDFSDDRFQYVSRYCNYLTSFNG